MTHIMTKHGHNLQSPKIDTIPSCLSLSKLQLLALQKECVNKFGIKASQCMDLRWGDDHFIPRR